MKDFFKNIIPSAKKAIPTDTREKKTKRKAIPIHEEVAKWYEIGSAHKEVGLPKDFILEDARLAFDNDERAIKSKYQRQIDQLKASLSRKRSEQGYLSNPDKYPSLVAEQMKTTPDKESENIDKLKAQEAKLKSIVRDTKKIINYKL